MKTTSMYIVMLSLVWLGGSCKKDTADPTPDVCSSIGQRANAISAAATAYSNSPTKANCEAYKKAANDYITSASGCPGVLASDIADARASIKDIVCQ